ncbi:hypothetical protein CU098_008726, partial [Rhizopus stolonifer]
MTFEKDPIYNAIEQVFSLENVTMFQGDPRELITNIILELETKLESLNSNIEDNTLLKQMKEQNQKLMGNVDKLTDEISQDDVNVNYIDIDSRINDALKKQK